MRKITLTDEEKIMVEALAAYLTKEQIGDYLGISRQTMTALIQRDPEVQMRVNKGKAKAITKVAQGLLQKALSGDTTCAIFYLKTQAGWRETNRMEVTDPDGVLQPVKIVIEGGE